MQNVLIADASDAYRALIRRSLSYAGYRCSEVSDGYEALDFIRTRRPEMVVFSTTLAGIDGLGLLAAVTQLPESDRPATLALAEGPSLDNDAITAVHGTRVMIKRMFSPAELRIAVSFLLDPRALRMVG